MADLLRKWWEDEPTWICILALLLWFAVVTVLPNPGRSNRTHVGRGKLVFFCSKFTHQNFEKICNNQLWGVGGRSKKGLVIICCWEVLLFNVAPAHHCFAVLRGRTGRQSNCDIRARQTAKMTSNWKIMAGFVRKKRNYAFVFSGVILLFGPDDGKRRGCGNQETII